MQTRCNLYRLQTSILPDQMRQLYGSNGGVAQSVTESILQSGSVATGSRIVVKSYAHGWLLFNGTSTPKGQFVPTMGKGTGSVG